MHAKRSSTFNKGIVFLTLVYAGIQLWPVFKLRQLGDEPMHSIF